VKFLFSAGIIVFRMKDEQAEFLLLHYPHDHWDLPKGKIEKGESKESAALRELKEETGLTAQLIEGFEKKFDYVFKQEGEFIKKTVYFFIGNVSSGEVTLSEEHIGFAWLSYDQALERLTFENAKEVLKEAKRFIT
jgi:bis(5'-nucleosidyl)-tetraphosphatase